jgi:UDP-N-acetylglucosamine 2-epimerase (non-hydrolysing)
MSDLSTVTPAVRVDVVLGTRPEAIKLAPVIAALGESEFAEPRIISTGQHPDLVREILAYFHQQPDVDLGLMARGQCLTDLLARAVQRLGEHARSHRPDLVVVQGDTTSALAGALAAFYEHVPVAHVEAGLRSGSLERPFPEEANRVLIGRVARLHFAPTSGSAQNLIAEGIDSQRVHVCGNTVIDALGWLSDSTSPSGTPEKWGVPADSRLVLVTAHRRENWGSAFATVCAAVREMADGHPDVHVVFVAHPNPALREVADRVLADHGRVHLAPPLPYAEFIQLLSRCAFALSDSGGVQEEATTLGKPVLLLRDVTERPEGVAAGTVQVVGTSRDRILEAAGKLLGDRRAYLRAARATHCFGDGLASRRIVGFIGHFFGRCAPPAPFTAEVSRPAWPDAVGASAVGVEQYLTTSSF